MFFIAIIFARTQHEIQLFENLMVLYVNGNKPYRNGVLDVKILLIESIKFHDISFYIATLLWGYS